MDSSDLVPGLVPGAVVLRKPEHERYARARSLLTPKLEAYRRAFDHLGESSPGEIHAMRGNASKLERMERRPSSVPWMH